ncbi:MAG TPA: choice-of-anchor D domain-containing protein, partial [Candidatus Dormibacteraeota bacterium]|nr:choice-of-anchor D domain-containing protein [Candidatus Dormibacteraeota bacterium]
TDIAFSSAAVTNGNPPAATSDYTATNTSCGTAIKALMSCTVSVTFKPTVPGAETATLVLTDADNTSPQNVPLSGTGASPPAPAVALSTTSLSFGGQFLTTTSAAAKNVTLTNTGNALLTISSIAASGDFAETNTCSATLAAGASCTISVKFQPTATGPRTGTLTITDNAPGNPHTAALIGAGWDFKLMAPSSLSVTPGSTGTFTVTMTPIGGFTEAVALVCSGLPLKSSCVVSPGSVTATDGVTAETATVTLTTTAILVPPDSRPTSPLSVRPIVLLLAAMMLLFLLPTARRMRLGPAMAVMLLILALAGCGGGAYTGANGTPKGTTNLTITGTTGTVNRTATVALTVN